MGKVNQKDELDENEEEGAHHTKVEPHWIGMGKQKYQEVKKLISTKEMSNFMNNESIGDGTKERGFFLAAPLLEH